MRKLVLTALLAGTVSAANAVILWDQSNFDASATSYIDTEFSDAGSRDFSTYLAMDFDNSTTRGWIIEKVTTYYAPVQFTNWAGTVTEAKFSVFDKVGPLPLAGNDPEAGMTVPITVSNVSGNLHVVADLLGAGMSRHAPPGDWWLVLTPIADFEQHAQAFHMPTVAGGLVLDETAARNPRNGFGEGSDWERMSMLLQAPRDVDASVLIEGEVVPEPGTLLAIGAGLAALALRRRSRYN